MQRVNETDCCKLHPPTKDTWWTVNTVARLSAHKCDRVKIIPPLQLFEVMLVQINLRLRCLQCKAGTKIIALVAIKDPLSSLLIREDLAASGMETTDKARQQQINQLWLWLFPIGKRKRPTGLQVCCSPPPPPPQTHTHSKPYFPAPIL